MASHDGNVPGMNRNRNNNSPVPPHFGVGNRNNNNNDEESDSSSESESSSSWILDDDIPDLNDWWVIIKCYIDFRGWLPELLW